MESENDKDKERKEKTFPFFPDHFVTELMIAYFLLLVLIVLASIFPVGLEDKADPLTTPEHIKPEWYFLSLFQLLKVVPRTIGILFPIVGVILLIFLPFLDRGAHRAPRKRTIAMAVLLVILAFISYMTIWGLLV